MRVLMADADRELLDIAQRYMSRHGHEVTIATNGLECVAILRRHLPDVPDVVVLHHGLLWGGSEGVQDVMQNVAPWSAIPVILTSDAEFPDFCGNSTSAPPAAQLEKPYRLAELLSNLRACTVDGPRVRCDVDVQ